MGRFFHVAAILALIGSALYAYRIKYDTIYLAEQVAKLNGQIAREKTAIAVLRAEWQLVNRPDRIQALADKHSDLVRRRSTSPCAGRTSRTGRRLPTASARSWKRSACSHPRIRRPARPATPAPPPAANREPTMNAPVHPHDLARHNANEPYEPAPGDAAYVDPARYAEGIPADGFAPQEPQEPPQQPKVRRIWGLVSDLFKMRLDKSGHRVFLVATGFACLYLIIGARLVQLGLRPDPPTVYRRAAAEISGARPDILDRNGEILATDVKTVSVFAEPRRIVDKDEAVELLTAVLPDLDARELREKLGQKRGFVWIKREITPRAAAGSLSPRPARHRLHAREQARLPERAVVVARLGSTNLDNQGIAGHREIHRRAGPGGPQHGRLRHRPGRSEAGAALHRPARAARAARRTREGHGEVQGQGGRRPHSRREHGRSASSLVSLPDFDPNNPADALDPRPHQPHRRRRLRDGLHLQGAHDGDGARLRQGQHQLDASTRAACCASGASRSTTIMPPAAC